MRVYFYLLCLVVSWIAPLRARAILIESNLDADVSCVSIPVPIWMHDLPGGRKDAPFKMALEDRERNVYSMSLKAQELLARGHFQSARELLSWSDFDLDYMWKLIEDNRQELLPYQYNQLLEIYAKRINSESYKSHHLLNLFEAGRFDLIWETSVLDTAMLGDIASFIEKAKGLTDEEKSKLSSWIERYVESVTDPFFLDPKALQLCSRYLGSFVAKSLEIYAEKIKLTKNPEHHTRSLYQIGRFDLVLDILSVESVGFYPLREFIAETKGLTEEEANSISKVMIAKLGAVPEEQSKFYYISEHIRCLLDRGFYKAAQEFLKGSQRYLASYERAPLEEKVHPELKTQRLRELELRASTAPQTSRLDLLDPHRVLDQDGLGVCSLCAHQSLVEFFLREELSLSALTMYMAYTNGVQDDSKGWLYDQNKKFPSFVETAKFAKEWEFPSQYAYVEYVKLRRKWCAVPGDFEASMRDFQHYLQKEQETGWIIPAEWATPSNKPDIKWVSFPSEVTFNPILGAVEGEELIKTLKCLTAEVPVIIGVPTELKLEEKDGAIEGVDLFENDRVGQDGMVQLPSGKIVDQSNYHAVSVWGYDDERQAFRFQNSWGASWGDQGYGWLSYDFVRKYVNEFRAIIPNKMKKRDLPEDAPLLDHQRQWFELLDDWVKISEDYWSALAASREVN